MNLTCLKNHLIKALNLASFQIGKNQNIPILQGGFLKAQKNKLLIETTNLESGFQIYIPAKTEEDGEIIVPIKTLSSFISGLDNEKIQLQKKDNNLYILSNNLKTIIKSFPLEDFPHLPKIEEKTKIIIPIKNLIFGLKSVINSASKSETRPEISSVYIFNQGDVLNFVATDSFRLSEKKINFNNDKKISFLIPSKYGVDLIKILENQEDLNGDIEVIIDKNQVLFKGKDFQYLSILTQGSFPEYQKLIPDSFISEALINLKELLKTIKSSALFSTRLNEIFLFLNPENKNIEIKALNTDLGEFSAKIPAKIQGQQLNLTFNYQYLLDGLSNIKESEVLLRFAGETKPLLISSINDNSLLYLLMPMRN